MAKTRNALTLVRRMMGDDAELSAMVDEARVNAEVAQLICEARQQAGLTQRQLAQRVGTQQSVIAKLEDADYEGHSLTMLRRIATALGHRVELRFKPVPKRSRAA